MYTVAVEHVQVLCHVAENIGKLNYLDYLEEKKFDEWPDNGRWILMSP